jgi:tetratricopeptide (TPR) repeat protein
VRAHRRIDAPTLVDIGPTLLALSGLSPAQDMPGRVLEEALTLNAPPRAVARPKGERNLAAMHFEAGRYAESARMYAELVKKEPKDSGLRASLAGALGALGRYDEAAKHLQTAIELEPLNPEAYQNRAAIYERQGKRDAAIADYRTALRYNPQYEPAKRALERLTGSAHADQPKTDAQKLAAKLAERASEAARRGDYKAALKSLDEAVRIAPRYALVYQYRANVAYLMGDQAAAKAALRKGLEIEPDNALFKNNLRKLEESAPPKKR